MARKKSPIPNTGSPKNSDDFRLIKGIGPALSTRLHEAGILTYHQLASLAPAELAARVRGLPEKQIIRQDWSGQARRLASQKSPTKSPKMAVEKKAVHQHYENFALEFLVDEKHAIRRTRVAHIQSGDADTWTGWEARQLIDFLARHTGVRAPVERPEKHVNQTIFDKEVQNTNNGAHNVYPGIRPFPLPNTAVASQGIPVEENTLPAVYVEVGAPQADTFCIRTLEVFTQGSDHPVTLLRQDLPYMVRLALDFSEVKESGDLPLLYKASVFARQLGGKQLSIGETLSTQYFSKNVTLDINCISLMPGIYRLQAFAEIRYEQATPGPKASLKGSYLQVY